MLENIAFKAAAFLVLAGLILVLNGFGHSQLIKKHVKNVFYLHTFVCDTTQ